MKEYSFNDLVTLATAAKPLNAADYGSDRQINAENAFFEACTECCPHLFRSYSSFAYDFLKATIVERIDAAIKLLRDVPFADIDPAAKMPVAVELGPIATPIETDLFTRITHAIAQRNGDEKVFMRFWGRGYVADGQADVCFAKDFTEANGYDRQEIEDVDALSIGEAMVLESVLLFSTITRIA